MHTTPIQFNLMQILQAVNILFAVRKDVLGQLDVVKYHPYSLFCITAKNNYVSLSFFKLSRILYSAFGSGTPQAPMFSRMLRLSLAI